jgi:hypothetical protein
MARRGEERVAVGHLHHLPEVHHGDAMADVAHDRQVVRHEQVREAELRLQVHQQVHHLRLHRDVERGDGLVADDQLGIQREGAGDAEALPLAARELVRVLRRRLGPEADAREQPLHPLLALDARHAGEVPERLGDDLAGGHSRVERRVRILEDDLQVLAPLAHLLARERGDLLALELHRAEVGSISRTTDFAVVVLPQPDSPTSASVSPRSTVKETSSTAWIGGRAGADPRLGGQVVLAQLLDGEERRGAHGVAPPDALSS